MYKFYICCMEVFDNTSLVNYNTFGIDVSAKSVIKIEDNADWKTLNKEYKDVFTNKHLILGGGSNILLTKNFPGTVLINSVKGKTITKETDNSWFVKANGGEVWHEFVIWTIEKGMYGLENLSLIPGSVGAAPMQNIGAYGVELKDVFYSLEAFDKYSGEVVTFSNRACEFGYRSSVFKTSLKDQYIIISVTFELSKNREFNTSYGAIESQLGQMKYDKLSAKVISDAVIAIRKSKLPNPAEIGNSGSFFKNPIIEQSQFELIKQSFPDVPSYETTDKKVKIAAGWLIEHSGWKGKTFEERYGVHKKQALVLVNYGGASGQEIYDLSQDIIADVKEKYGIELEREVNVI